MSVRIRIYREAKKWKLGIQFGARAEKSLVISVNPDKTLRDSERLYSAINDTIEEVVSTKKVEPLAPTVLAPVSPRRTILWPGEIEEGDKDWIIAELVKDELGIITCSLRDDSNSTVKEFSFMGFDDKFVERIESLVKRPIKDPRQIEMFEPPNSDLAQ